MCVVCSRRLPLGSVQEEEDGWGGIWTGQVTGRRRGDGEASKNVLDCCLSGIKLVAAFLYCGYRNQTKSSPDNMSMTSLTSPPDESQTLHEPERRAFLTQTCLFLFLRLAAAAVVLESWAGFTLYVPHLHSIS